MKKKKEWICIRVLGLSLLSLFLLALPVSAQEDQTGFIIQAVDTAIKQTSIDLQAQAIKDFLEASCRYDNLTEEQKSRIPLKTTQDLQTVQEQIRRAVCTSQGITAEGGEWYAQTNITEGSQAEEVLQAAENQYGASTPEIVYYREIRYQDIRDDSPYRHRKMISLTFPVPFGYDSLTNPKIVTYLNGELLDLSPERQGDVFYIQRARTLENILILSVPVALTDIQIQETASLNPGQQLLLKPEPVPEQATESYTLEWFSSDEGIAQVNASGIVTGVGTGSCIVTAAVKERPEISASCTVTVMQGTHSLDTSVGQAMEEVQAYILSADPLPTIGSEWFVIGLARSGLDPGHPYFSTYYNHFVNYLEENNGVLTKSVKYTEYSKAVLTVTAMGKDARNIAGYNLFKPLADFESVAGQGINGPIWALIALNSNPEYTIPKDSGVPDQTTEEKLIDTILSQETKSGGWSMTGDAPDSDITAMVLQAFAFYYGKDNYEEVTAAVDRSLELLGRMQNSLGGFSSWGTETLESAAQVLTALSALGIDPQKDERFIKGGNWLVQNLLSYRIEGSGFMHVKAGSENNGGGVAGELNGMATEQGYYAMTAYQRMLNAQTSLYDMSDLQVKKGEKGDGTGTGLATPTPASITPEGARRQPGAAIANPTVPAAGSSISPTVFPTPAPTKAPSVSLAASATPVPSASQAASSTVAGVSSKSTLAGKTNPSENAAVSSGSKNREEEEAAEVEGGWNFEAVNDTQGEAETWSFDTGELRELLSERTVNENPEKQSLLASFTWGFFGALVGAGLPQGGKYLWKRRKKG